MPLEYTGTIEEHMACRRSATVFDVSHLGTVRISGPDAFERLQRTLTNDLAKIAPGRAQYTHLLDESDGSVLDDIIVWWHPEDAPGEPVFDVMPNASNTDRVLGAIGGDDITANRAVLAVQGPEAKQRVAEFWPEAGAIGRFRVDGLLVERRGLRRRRHRLHGEPGLEVSVPSAQAESLWTAIVDSWRAAGGARGARHTSSRGRVATPRTRARTRDHAAPGRPGVGGRLRQAGVPRQAGVDGGARAGSRPLPRRHRHRRPAAAAIRAAP